MTEKIVMDALVQMKRTGNLLNEVEDLTRQLGQAIDRNDQVSMQMLVGMREEPLDKLRAADQAIREQLEALSGGDEAAALAAMLNGGPPAQPEERAQQLLCEQVAANRRRLNQIIELDKGAEPAAGAGECRLPAQRSAGIKETCAPCRKEGAQATISARWTPGRYSVKRFKY